MPSWLWWLLAAIAVVAAFFAWGFARLRRNSERIHAAFLSTRIDDIPALAARCSVVFQRDLGVALDAADPMAAARHLDQAILSGRAQVAFARPDLEWAYALHVGAWLGELVRSHTGGRWLAANDGAPVLQIGEPQRDLKTFPFEKVLKHRFQGDPGDLIAYVMVSLKGPDVLAEAARTGTRG